LDNKNEITQNLRHQQHLFCGEYLKDFNGTQAAIRAGYSSRTARQQASRLLTKADIREVLQTLYTQALKKIEAEVEHRIATAQEVLEEDTAVALVRIGDLLEKRESGQVAAKDIQSLPEMTQAAVQEIKTNREGGITIKLYSKHPSLERLHRYHQLSGQGEGGLLKQLPVNTESQDVEPETGDVPAETVVEFRQRAATWLRGVQGRLGTDSIQVLIDWLEAGLDEEQPG